MPSLPALWLSNLLAAIGLTVWLSWLMRVTWQMIVLSLFLALLALFLSTQKQRYIALLNSGSLIVVALMILVEAIQRWQIPSR